MTQKQFYKTKAWRRARDAYIKQRIQIDGGICEVCHRELGKIVHHKIWLTDANCCDPDISLNLGNFRYECQTCHNQEKNPEIAGSLRYRFGPDGEIMAVE